MAYSKELADRIREAIADQPAVREVGMFGGLSFLVNGKLAVTASNGGDLLLRCDPARVEDLTARGAQVAQMSGGRQMSRGWITVSSPAVDAAEDFGFWLGVALAYNKEITGKGARRR